MIVSDNSYPKYWLRTSANGPPDGSELLYCVAAPQAHPVYWGSGLAFTTACKPRSWRSTDYTSEACILNTSRLHSIDAAAAAKWLLANGHGELPNASV